MSNREIAWRERAEESAAHAMQLRADLEAERKAHAEVRQAFKDFALAVMTESIKGYADAAIVGGGPFDERHALRSLQTLVAAHAETRRQLERMRAAFDWLPGASDDQRIQAVHQASLDGAELVSLRAQLERLRGLVEKLWKDSDALHGRTDD